MKKIAGVLMEQEHYYEVGVEDENITLKTVIDGNETEYEVSGGGGVERKNLYVNPDTSAEMTGDTLFLEEDIIGYDYLAFTITTTSGAYDVEEWCEIEPLRANAGQFAVSIPIDGVLFCRKVYRSGGAVKPSTAVYEIGKTTGDRANCIIASVDAVKIL